jgi:DNA-binding CsgD family transcriptional regulator
MLPYNDDSCKEVCFFVGDELAFSDCVVKHANAEFTSLTFVRKATLPDVLATPDQQAAQCRIIVVDDSLVDELMDRATDIFAYFTTTAMALSYRNTTIAEMFLRRAASDALLSKVGVLPMRLEIDHWMSVLRLLICGERYIPYELFNHATAPDQNKRPQPVPAAKPRGRLGKLTEREKQVLTSVSEGKQNKIIAAELALSEHTVKLHIHKVIAKLGVHNRTEAAICFLADQPGSNGRVS